MNVVVKEPGKPAYVKSVRRSNEILGELVGGTPVTCLRMRNQPGIDIVGWCDDDGISKELPVNFARPTDSSEIRGPVVLTGMTETKNGPDWGGLTPREVFEALELLKAIGVES